MDPKVFITPIPVPCPVPTYPSGGGPVVGGAAAAGTVLTTKERRKQLKEFAESQATNPDRVDAMAKIADKSADLVKGLPDPATAMVDDMSAVLVGDGLLIGRDKGSSYAGDKFPGFAGFDKSFHNPFAPRDNQMHHAMAGIHLGYHYPSPVESFVKWYEMEPWDKRLYDSTFALGNGLNNNNYSTLGDRIKENLGKTK